MLLVEAPTGNPGELPLPWYGARLAGPALAAALAAGYLAQRRPIDPGASGATPDFPRSPGREQARVLLAGLALMLAVARLIAGPSLPAAKLLVFGLADVAAFQLIHFGVVARSFATPERGQTAAVVLFGVSWGLRDLLLAGIGAGAVELPLAFAGGLVLGLAVAALSRALRRSPGGWWTGAAAHWLLVYLVFGFVR